MAHFLCLQGIYYKKVKIYGFLKLIIVTYVMPEQHSQLVLVRSEKRGIRWILETRMGSWKRRGSLNGTVKDFHFMVWQSQGPREVQRSKRVACQWGTLQKYKMVCKFKVLLFPSPCRSTPSTKQVQKPPLFGHLKMSDLSEPLGYKRRRQVTAAFLYPESTKIFHYRFSR